MKSHKLQTSEDAADFIENANALVKLFQMFVAGD